MVYGGGGGNEPQGRQGLLSKLLSSISKCSVANNVGRGGIPKTTKNSYSPCRTAFTLAEVLITLGIIGVVAAMILPTLIANYQKQEVVTRLKYSFNIFSNMIRRAEADYGNITEWGLESEGGEEYDIENNRILRAEFVSKYMLPYLNGAHFSAAKSLADCGYKRTITYPAGSPWISIDKAAPILEFPNGIIALISGATGTDSSDPNKKVILGFTFVIDINGPSGQNCLGRDVFFVTIPFAVNTRVLFFQYYSLDAQKRMTINKSRSSRPYLINDCKTYGANCGYLIQQDGWQIKDDYPW